MAYNFVSGSNLMIHFLPLSIIQSCGKFSQKSASDYNATFNMFVLKLYLILTNQLWNERD